MTASSSMRWLIPVLCTLVLSAASGHGSAAAGSGLVAAYGFNEGAGTTVADTSGSGNTGAVANTTWSAQGKFGGALSFNGTSARVNVPNSSSLQLSSTLTLEAWVNPSAISNAWRDVVYKGDDNYYLMATTQHGGNVPAGGGTFGGSNRNAFGTGALPLNTWSYLATTYDGATLRMYVNGSLVASQAASGAPSLSTNALQIGGDSIYGQYFKGMIDEVRVYNTALSPTDIQSDMTTPVGSAAPVDTTAPSVPGTLTAAAAGSGQINLSWGAATDDVAVTGYRVERCSGSSCTNFAQIAAPAATSFQDTGLTAATNYSYRVRATDGAGNLSGYSNTTTATTTAASGSGLVAAYSFDEGTGTTVADTSGNGNTGTTANTAWSTQGKYSGALTFNGVNARINIPNSSSLQLTSGMTLEAWVNPATISGSWRDVIYKGNDNYYLMATTDRTGGVPAAGGSFGATNSNANAYATSLLPLNTWTFLAATYDGAAIRLYVNGTLTATQTQTGAITTSTNQLQIGSDSIWGQYFNGLIDQIRIYNTPLTAAAIQTDMTTPIGPPGPNDTTPPSAPGTLTATAGGTAEIDLSWGAATDDNAVAAYRIDRCQGASCTDFSHLVQTGGPGTTFADTSNLAGGTTYRYQVRAVDGAGNLGPYSNAASATTVAGSASLVAAYSFDEGSGTSVGDASGFGNAGTLAGATWSSQGKFGGALAFNGTSAVVNISNASSLQLTSGMTLEAWVNPGAISTTWRDVVYKGNDNYYLMGTTDHSGATPAAGGNFGPAHTNANAFATSALPLNSWTHLAATYDGATVRLYVNGALAATQAATGPISTSTNPLQIGGDSLFGQYFNGRIDEVRIYNAPLSAAAIQTDMNSAIAGGLPTTPPNLAAAVKSSTQVSLTWGTSTDLAGVTGYRVERCQGDNCTNFTEIAAPASTTYNDTGLAPSTRYTYRVRAIDANGLFGPYSDTATAWTGLQISPHQVAVTPGEIQQFAAALPGGGSTPVNWSVDGIAGGTMLIGTIDATGVYTAGTAAGPHLISGTTFDQTQSGTATAFTTNYAGTFTHHNDNLRTGANTAETVLTPANVNASNFGKLFSQPLDGIAFASPLYAANVAVPNQGTHNIVFVATEHDSVYAFDADGRTSNPLWKVSFINPAAGITTVPNMDTGECCDIPTEIGITGTPVIDAASNTLYVVVATKEVAGGTTKYPLRLHALDLSTGAEKFGGPVLIQATVPGTGLGSSGGQLPFDSLRENQHAALLLLNGVVYFSFSSHGDYQAYHGWVFGYDAKTLQQKLVFCLTPNNEGAGVWMGGGGLASDSTGAIYFVSGDGTFNGTNAWGDSYIKLTTAGVVADSFTPYNQAQIDASNADLGSGGVLLLPDQPGAHPHLMFSSGKDGTIYLVDRDNMGKYNTSTNNIVQTLPGIFPPNGSSGSEPGNFSSPVYFGGYVFFSPNGGNVQGFKVTNGLLATSATLRSTSIFPDRGTALAASANGASNGILWATQRNGEGAPAVLFAFDPTGSSNGTLKELYDSAQAGSRDTLDVEAKFTVPLVANGKVFVAGETRLTAFGLLP